MAGISNKAAGVVLNKEKTFQGQRFDDDLGLNWVQFKWRNHDPQIGRFIEVDPLSEEYEYNSTYAFSENKVTNHVELEGLEAVSAGSVQGWLGSMFGSITTGYASAIDYLSSITFGDNTKTSTPITPSTNFVTNLGSETTYGTNFLGWVESTKAPNSTVNTGPSLFKNETKTIATAEIEANVGGKNGSVKASTSLDGATTKIESKIPTKIKGVPSEVSMSQSSNSKTGETQAKVKVVVGSSSPIQPFGQIELTKKANKTTTSVSVGVQTTTKEGKTTVTRSGYIKKAF